MTLEGFQSGIPLLRSLVAFVHGPTAFVVSSLKTCHLLTNLQIGSAVVRGV